MLIVIIVYVRNFCGVYLVYLFEISENSFYVLKGYFLCPSQTIWVMSPMSINDSLKLIYAGVDSPSSL